MTEGPGGSKIVETYRARTRRAAELHRAARDVLPGGIVHDSRRMFPYGIYGDRALGSRKWDIDGNEYVDYFGGHGSLLLGHQHPEVLKAIHAQLGKGMHLAAAHELEVQWARLIQEMVPSVERVRFTASGTEATPLAMRLRRSWRAACRAAPWAAPRTSSTGSTTTRAQRLDASSSTITARTTPIR